MKFCSISDLHIKQKGDLPSKLLERFVTTDEVKEADRVYFLGDIFDFMVGTHYQYLDKYDFFFQTVEQLILAGKQVYYIEGNHDFHLENVMNKFKQRLILKESFVHSKEFILEEIDSKRFFFTHGHEVDQNTSYLKWKNIYSSTPFKIFVNHVLPYALVEHFGNKASKDSKKRNMKKFVYNQSKDLYREGAEILINKENIDFLITGHTHIAECLQIGNSIYANNGFPQSTEQFIHFDGEKPSLVNL